MYASNPYLKKFKERYGECAVARARRAMSFEGLKSVDSHASVAGTSSHDTTISVRTARGSQSQPDLASQELDLLDPDSDVKPSFSELGSRATLDRPIIIEEIAPFMQEVFEPEKDEDIGLTETEYGSRMNKVRSWAANLDFIKSKKYGKPDKRLSRRARRFYKRQDELISMFEKLDEQSKDLVEDGIDLSDNRAVISEEEVRARLMAGRVAKATFAINFALLVVKAVAVALSGSLSVISSLVDSCVDLLSGVVMWWATRAIQKSDIYKYPQGRTRLGPVAVIILSVVMGLASLQLIIESVDAMVSGNMNPDVGPITIGIIAGTVVTKLALYLFCRSYKDPSIQAMCQDHRNDVASNIVALAGGFIGTKLWNYADPIGAIIISLYIIWGWWRTGAQQIKLLTGLSARPAFMQRLTWICVNHDSRILYVDTVRAFHFGTNFIVEVDIVLAEDMMLREAHDIGESLQQKLEKIEDVERAFVHLDYEYEHHPSIEHKAV